jgi:hypothetical protein
MNIEIRRPIDSVAGWLCRDFFRTLDGTDVPLGFTTRHHHFMAAPQTADAKIRSGAKHQKALVTTGMRLFHGQNIAQLNIHDHSPLILSQYCLAACSSLLTPYS